MTRTAVFYEAWSGTTAYLVGDVVTSGGVAYLCISAHTNHVPPNGTYWLALSGTGSGVTYGTPALTLGTAAAAGSIDEAIRRDSTVVAFDATAPSTQAFGDSASAGSAGVAARRDHKHAMPATPVTSFAKSGGSALTGAVTISEGSGITLTPSGNDIAIAASGSSGIPTDGWMSVSGLSYSSVDGPTGVVSTSSDLTGTIGVGARIKFTQTTVKYFIVTAIDASTMTIYGGTDYALVNASISSAYWSPVKAPHGFPLDPAKWTLETTATNQPDKASASASTWYGGSGLSPTGPSLDIHIGQWDVYFETTAFSARAAGGSLAVAVSLSTANNTAGDQKLTSYCFANQSSGTVLHTTHFRRSTILLASKTTYYLNIFTDQSNSTHLTLYGSSTLGNIVIRAVCAYL